jgi:hypothetical protein
LIQPNTKTGYERDDDGHHRRMRPKFYVLHESVTS